MVATQDTGQPLSPREYVRARGIKIRWIADQLGVPHSVISDVLARKKGPKATRRWGPQIARLLGVPVRELFPDLEEEVGVVEATQEETQEAEGQESAAPGPRSSETRKGR